MFIVKETDNGMIVEFWGVLNNEETLICYSNYVSSLTYQKSIENIRNNALLANIEDRSVDNCIKLRSPKIVIGINERNHFNFYLKARNGTILTRSTSFKSKQDCLFAVECLRNFFINEEGDNNIQCYKK